MIFIFKICPHILPSSHEGALTVCALLVADGNSQCLNLPLLCASLRVTNTHF
jgi:hypothetical protein